MNRDEVVAILKYQKHRYFPAPLSHWSLDETERRFFVRISIDILIERLSDDEDWINYKIVIKDFINEIEDMASSKTQNWRLYAETRDALNDILLDLERMGLQ